MIAIASSAAQAGAPAGDSCTPAASPGAGEGERALAIDALLPQTQCRQCGFEGCLPYARAIAAGQAAINRCPPGGEAGIAALAQLMGLPVLPPDPSCGAHRPLRVARIDESRCIGCTLCIQACPVDAIAGAVKAMHTVVAAECTGCDLCVPPCPMDCIVMVEVQPARAWTRADADQARARMHARRQREARERRENDARLAAKALHKLEELESRAGEAQSQSSRDEIARRKAIVQAALERVRQRRLAAGDGAAAAPRPDGTRP
jgi:electron transport complex protein RnfB